MKNLFVAGQDEHTREWIPVAELRELEEGYELRYTRGAQRLPGFAGLSRMQALDKVFYSPTLFPFFSNRLIPRSRPEYNSYIRWLGLDSMPMSPLDMLAVTGGVRATDNYELFAPPRVVDGALELDFFVRGLRYLPSEVLALVMRISEGSEIFLMKDVQNTKDASALAVRTEAPWPMLLGYVPRYYTAGLTRLLDAPTIQVSGHVRRLNTDAPLDMRVLVSLRASVPSGFQILSEVTDFLPLTASQTEQKSSGLLLQTNLDIV